MSTSVILHVNKTHALVNVFFFETALQPLLSEGLDLLPFSAVFIPSYAPLGLPSAHMAHV